MFISLEKKPKICSIYWILFYLSYFQNYCLYSLEFWKWNNMGQHLRSIGWNVFSSHTPGILVITSTPSDSSRLCKWAQRLINPLPTRISPLCHRFSWRHLFPCLKRKNKVWLSLLNFWFAFEWIHPIRTSTSDLLSSIRISGGEKNEWKSPRANWVFWCVLVLLATEASALNGDKRKPIPTIAFLTWTWMYSLVTNRVQQWHRRVLRLDTYFCRCSCRRNTALLRLFVLS